MEEHDIKKRISLLEWDLAIIKNSNLKARKEEELLQLKNIINLKSS